MPKEIEIKLPVAPEIFQRVQAQLATLPLKSDEKHLDIYFSPNKGFIHEQFPYEWLSIRSRGTKHKVCYKHFHPAGAERHTHCDEHEFLTDNPEAQTKLLQSLGFRPIITVDKHRQTFQFMDTEVALDTVKDLGHFIEIEANERSDLDIGQAQVQEAVNALGLTGIKRDLRGYPFLLIERLKA